MNLGLPVEVQPRCLALDGHGWLEICPNHSTLENGLWYPLDRRLCDLIWVLWRREKSVAVSGIEPQFLGCPTLMPPSECDDRHMQIPHNNPFVVLMSSSSD
jgi:hypothetical protein